MANPEKYGFRWAQGQGQCPAPLYYSVASGYDGQDEGANSCAISIGDPVKRVSDGTVALAAGSDEVLGIVTAIKPYWDGTAMVFGKNLPNQNTWGTVEARRPYVGVVHANAGLWEVDCDAAHGTATIAGYTSLIGNNIDHVLTGDTTAGTAKPELDMDTEATTDATWRIEGISKTLDNRDITAANVKLLVKINESEEGGSASAGNLYNGI